MSTQAQTADLGRQRLSGPEAKSLILTSREIEVLKLIASGFTNKQLAFILGISPKTSDCHRTRIYAKLGVHSIVELLMYAVRKGLISIKREAA